MKEKWTIKARKYEAFIKPERTFIEVRAAIDAEEPVGPPPLRSLVEDVFAEVPAFLDEELAEIEGLPRQKLGGVHA